MSNGAETRHETVELEAQIEDRHLQPDLCTIYRPHGDEFRKMERWITAKGGSFIDLYSMR